jgi:DNA modification methylase
VVNLMQGNCLELMKQIPNGSVDFILTDPPYGTTACKWDTVIPFEPMWEQLHRIVKPNGAICLFGSEPFSSALRISNIKNFKYDWIWDKQRTSGALNANRMPLKSHEIVSVFYKKQVNYNPIMTPGPKISKGGSTGGGVYGKTKSVRYTSDQYYPRTIQSFKACHNMQGKLHPTQKPVTLLEYLIKTYTLEGETVLDFTMGSGSTGVACVNTNRKFIGIELDPDYFKIAQDRIAAAQNEKAVDTAENV